MRDVTGAKVGINSAASSTLLFELLTGVPSTRKLVLGYLFQDAGRKIVKVPIGALKKQSMAHGIFFIKLVLVQNSLFKLDAV